MKILVTCGPSFEPIDRVRRITNFSTGRLGVTLANAFALAGHEVTCLKGQLAVAPDPLEAVRLIRFDTNESLAQALAAESTPRRDVAVFHAAALCDYSVAQVEDQDGIRVNAGKIPTRQGNLVLTLQPAPKILPRLRGWFPLARLVGWKFEVDGTREEVLAKASHQMKSALTDACVVNGPAWGQGFGWVLPDGHNHEVPDPSALARLLVHWVSNP